MSWQLVFKAPDEEDAEFAGSAGESMPAQRKPVSMTLQLDPGTVVLTTAGDDEDDD